MIAPREGKTITLNVTPAGSASSRPPQDLHFFSEDGLIAYDQPQPIKPDGRGGFTLALPVSQEGPANATKLLGVLTSENGWTTDSTLRGLKVDVAISGQHSAVSTQPSNSASSGPTGSVSQPSTLNPQLPPTAQPPPAAGSLLGTLLFAFVG